MKRKHPGDRVQRLRLNNLTKMRDFQSRCIRWAEDHLEWLEVAEPVIPAELHDRAADNWEPLLAIADTAGGDWPHRARKAAITLSSDETEETAGVMLLADIQQIFEARGSTRLKSSELVAALSEVEDRPWPEWRNGKAITAVQVACLLKPFGIKPKNIRDVSVFKGYEQSDFDDAISRYLPVSPATPLQDCKDRDSATAVPYFFRPNIVGGCCIARNQVVAFLISRRGLGVRVDSTATSAVFVATRARSG